MKCLLAYSYCKRQNFLRRLRKTLKAATKFPFLHNLLKHMDKNTTIRTSLNISIQLASVCLSTSSTGLKREWKNET